MKINEIMQPGERVEIGSYTFTPEKIIAFAKQFDPQFFHLDAEKARDSVFGGLCASGWHISAAMMKCNVASIMAQAERMLRDGKAPPKLGPSPGFRNLKWLKPVFADDTITYFMQYNSDRPIPNRPGRNICDMTYEGFNQHGEKVYSADCSVVEFD